MSETMTTLLIYMLCAMMSLSCRGSTAGQPDAGKPSEQPPERSTGSEAVSMTLDDTLRLLEARGKDLSTLSMKLKMTEGDPTIGDFTTRTGRLWIQNLADGSTRARVLMDRKQIDDKIFPEKIEYVLDGRNLIDRDYARKVQVTRQVLRPGEKMNLLKLGEGPFPLPIGQSPEEVKRQFDASLVDKHDGPDGSVMVRLIPKSGTSLARKFKSIEVWIDRNDGTPIRIDVLDVNGVSLRSNELSEVRFNEAMTDATFKLDPIPDDWRRIDEQFND